MTVEIAGSTFVEQKPYYVKELVGLGRVHFQGSYSECEDYIKDQKTIKYHRLKVCINPHYVEGVQTYLKVKPLSK